MGASGAVRRLGVSMSAEIDPVALENRLTKMEGAISSGFGSLKASIDALTAAVGLQNGRISAIEKERSEEAARQRGRNDVQRRYIAAATGGISVVIVVSQAIIQLAW